LRFCFLFLSIASSISVMWGRIRREGYDNLQTSKRDQCHQW